MRKILSVVGLLGLVAATCFYLYTSFLVHQHRKIVAANFKDPESAQFRNEKLTKGWTLKTSMLCGEVNSKNGFGAYSGYVMFASPGGEKPYFGSEPGPDAFIEGYCE